MEFIKKLLSESSDISCMRFMSVTSLFFSFFVASYGLFFGKDMMSLSGMFLGAAFGGKVAQKFEEKNAVAKSN